MLVEASEPIWVPVVKWELREEMKQVGRDVVNYEMNTGQLPQRSNWLDWLDYRYASREVTRDTWGNTYELQIWADSVGILSYGPDRTRSTEDDFVVVTPRQRRGR